MGLLPKRGNKITGEVRFEDTDLLKLRPQDLRDRRGRDIGMIFQDPLSSLNPVIPLGVQVAEVLERHQGRTRQAALREARGLLDSGTALVMITHDLGVVAGLCDTVNVLYAGKVVERAERHDLFAEPRHPYTHGLLQSVPRLDLDRGGRLHQIRGSVSDNIPWSEGCAFAPRCDRVIDDCIGETIPLEPTFRGGALRCTNPVPQEVPV